MMPDAFNDGWRRFSGTWHYVSASSFKVYGDVTSELPIGTKLRYHQMVSGEDTTYHSQVAKVSYNSTTNYTTVTLQGGSTAIANAPISLPCYSYEEIAQGFPGMGDIRVAKVALTKGNANAFAFAWENPEDSQIIVHKVLVNRTTAGGTANAVLDIGPAKDATTTADTIIDGLDLNATGLADSLADKGANGTTRSVLLEANGGTTLAFITGKILVANAAALVGYVYIYYSRI